MIAVDTSALMAVLLSEPQADACAKVLEAEKRLLISAGTVAEALIVAERRTLPFARGCWRQALPDAWRQRVRRAQG